MIYVYKFPLKLSNGFCHGSGNPIQFENVDWFNIENPNEPDLKMPADSLMKYIAGKRYAAGVDRLLVIDSEGLLTMTIRFTPCPLCRNVMPYLEVCQACGRINNNREEQA